MVLFCKKSKTVKNVKKKTGIKNLNKLQKSLKEKDQGKTEADKLGNK